MNDLTRIHSLIAVAGWHLMNDEPEEAFWRLVAAVKLVGEACGYRVVAKEESHRLRS